MPAAPERFLSRPLLRQLAGEQLFASGEQCFAGGGVRQIQAGKDRVSARVAGARTYRVKLWRRRGELQFRCDCDEGRTETFCQHCVAVGLAWLAHPGEPGPAPADAAGGPASAGEDEARREEERRLVAAHLRTFDPARLASLLLEATDYDEILRRRLLLEATGIAPGPPETRGTKAPPHAARPLVAAYRRLLREAIQPGGLVDFHSMPDYVQGIEEAIAPLARWLRRGWHEEVIGLVEFAAVELDAAADRADLGDPLLNRVYDDLQRYHLDACRHAAPDPRQLAARLLHYELEGGLGLFNNAAKTYADILGAIGRSEWRELLIREWRWPAARVGEAPGSDAPRPLIDHRLFQVQMLMERLADAEGDLDALLALKRADLRGVHDHVALAEWLQSIGRHREAVLCAEEAARRFDGPAEKRVWREFLIDAYQRAGRGDAALSLGWEQFEEVADLEHFRRLKNLVQDHAAARWPEWRGRAVARLRAGVAHGAPGVARADGSRLVEVLLDENLIDDAWEAAAVGGCRADLWFLLADRREREHPEDALAIYRRQIDQALAAAGAHAYREAVDLLGRVRALLRRAGREPEYERYLAGLRSTHRKKRALLRLLAAAGL